MSSEDQEKKYELLSYILNSPIRTRIFICLIDKPHYAYEIAIDFSLNLSVVLRSLKELQAQEIIECVNPQSIRKKIYKLSNAGKDISEDIIFTRAKEL